MPNLSAFADDGVRFARHHPVFPSVTRLNAASMVTGCLPATHGIAGNRMVFRDFDTARTIDVLEPDLTEVDAAIGGKTLLVATLGERLAAAGREYVAVVSGTSGNAYTHAPRGGQRGGSTIHPDFTLPRELFRKLESSFGVWPAQSAPNIPRLRHATDIFLNYAIDERDATVSFIWYSEPDKSQHAFGVGSPMATDALMATDQEFGKMLDGLRSRGMLDDTDFLIVSDHGYTTVVDNIDVVGALAAEGFPKLGEPGGVAACSNGGTVLLYVTDSDAATATRLAEWLMSQEWCGAILGSSRIGDIPGVLPAEYAGIDGVRGPDLAMSLRWTYSPNAAGVFGIGYSSGSLTADHGDHGAMSRSEMRNTLIANGPSFSRGQTSTTPSGNVDLTPTILSILSIDADGELDGRVLNEVLAGETMSPTVNTEVFTSASGAYRQYLKTSSVGGVRYVDEGNVGEAPSD
jgi:arylsulfatase A-like enzyme